ncbi:MAG: hypothetical protein KDE22_08720 [Rhodobacterales bacterium]|nr:hypothetical protein [Rhodobacterales bacterium]
MTVQTQMTTESDVYRTAHLLVVHYGDMAPVGAVAVADEMERRGDAGKQAKWLRVARAAEDLLIAAPPKPGQSVH